MIRHSARRVHPCASFIVCLAALLSFPLTAENAARDAPSTSLSSVTLVPRDVFIGDQALLSFPSATLSRVVEAGERSELSASEIPPPTDSVTVQSITLARGSGSGDAVIVSVSFIPWNTGSVPLPPFSWKGVTVTPPAVTVASIVDRTGISTLEPPRPPLLVPGTTWLIYSGIALLTLGTVIAWLLIRRLLSYSLANQGARRASRRRRTVRSDLNRLEKRIKRFGVLPWYAELSIAFRRYLALTCGDSDRLFYPLTPSEIGTAMSQTGELKDLSEEAQGWLRAFDRIRFSGVTEEDERRTHMGELRLFVQRAEENLKGGVADGRL